MSLTFVLSSFIKDKAPQLPAALGYSADQMMKIIERARPILEEHQNDVPVMLNLLDLEFKGAMSLPEILVVFSFYGAVMERALEEEKPFGDLMTGTHETERADQAYYIALDQMTQALRASLKRVFFDEKTEGVTMDFYKTGDGVQLSVRGRSMNSHETNQERQLIKGETIEQQCIDAIDSCKDSDRKPKLLLLGLDDWKALHDATCPKYCEEKTHEVGFMRIGKVQIVGTPQLRDKTIRMYF